MQLNDQFMLHYNIHSIIMQFQEYHEATEVYLDILKADQDRYGRNDLICAVDYHNLGVTSVLGGDLEAALDYFQESVILKRACFEENDTTVAVSTYYFNLSQVNIKETIFASVSLQ